MSNFNFFGGISAFLLVVCTFCLFFVVYNNGISCIHD